MGEIMLTVEEKAELFDALFGCQKMKIESAKNLGDADYQYLQISIWTDHLSPGTETECAKRDLLYFLLTRAGRGDD